MKNIFFIIKENIKIFFLKEFFIGFSIFFFPFINFIKPFNIKQLAIYDIYLFIVSQIIVLLILIFISIILFSIIKKFLKKPYSIFIIICFGYYLLFYFSAIYEYLVISIFKSGGALKFTLFFLFLIWFVISILFFYFKNFEIFFRRSILIFASINIIFFFLSYIEHFFNESKDSQKVVQLQDINNILNLGDDNLIISEIKEKKNNIYYIILDGMASLDFFASKFNDFDQLQIEETFNQSGITYIKDSYSSYNNTKMTLASIMEIDYLSSVKNKKYGGFFPSMMYQKKINIPLPNLINKLDIKFFWIGNYGMPCLSFSEQPWTCIISNKSRNLRYLGNTLYFGTPLSRIINLLLDKDAGQRNVKFYMDYLRLNNKLNDKKFVFIHQMSPHAPFTVTKDCKPFNDNDYLDRNEGYKASYLCNIKEVIEFTKFVSALDPEGVIIFQGDHGWPERNPGIFNAIKAPKSCFEKFGKPRSTVNTIRFTLNCSYGLKIPFYSNIIHYQIDDKAEKVNKLFF